MNKPKTSFVAVGDMLIQRMIPQDHSDLEPIRDYISKADARFFNLETVLHRGGIYGNQFNGGSYHRSDPNVLNVAKSLGFNMCSFANNHTFDYGYGGLEATLDTLNASDFVHAGVGRNLDEAAAPAYLETKHGRVALISFTASFVNDAAIAGRQSRRVIGRPGVNPLRILESIEVPEDYFSVLQDIANNSGVNAALNIARAENNKLKNENNSVVTIGTSPIMFLKGSKLKHKSVCNRADLVRLAQNIYEAKHQSDYIILSIHAHHAKGSTMESVPDYLEEFCHYAIDLGAHAVIGHGPHLLRPLELYKGKPIFYSLGDFVLHNESFPYAPEDFFTKYGLTSDSPLCDVYRKRSKDYTRGLLTDPRMMESVIPYFEIEDDKLIRLELLPIELGFGKPRYRIGDPHVCTDRGIIERLASMSAHYGTEINIDERGIGIVKLP